MTAGLKAIRATIDLLGTPAALLELDGRIDHLNPAYERLLGRTANELRGRPVATLLAPDAPDRIPAFLTALLGQGSLTGVGWSLRSDGTSVPVEVMAEIVRAPDGTPVSILASVRDLRPQLELLDASAVAILGEPGDDLLVTITRAARNLVGARYAALGVVEDGRLVRFIPEGMPEEVVAGIDHPPVSHGLLGAMIALRRTLRLAEIDADPRHSGFPPGHPPMRSFLGTPIRAGDTVYGNLYFTDKLDAPTFSFLDERLAELFASHAAVAILSDRQRRALEASERNLAEVQRVARMGSWEWDLVTDVLLWSDEHCRVYGIEPGTFAGTNAAFHTFVHPDDLVRVLEADRRTVEEGAPFELDFRIIRPDGAVRTIREVGEATRDETGRPVRMVGTTRDITEEVAGEEERARLVSVVEQTGDSILVADPDGTIMYVNPAFTRLYDYEPHEVVGRNARLLNGGYYARPFWTDLLAAVSSRGTWSGTIFNWRRDGTPVEVESVISRIRDPAGRITSFVQADRDMTRERELEGALARRAHEQETIQTALSRIDPAAGPAEIARVACAEVVRLGEADSAWVIEFGRGAARVLAVAGPVAGAIVVDQLLPLSASQYLLERSWAGPWSEAWQVRPEDGSWGEMLTATGLRAAACAPLRGSQGLFGVIGVGSHDPAIADRTAERLPALTTYAAGLGAFLGPVIEERQRVDAERAEIHAILEQRTYTPFVQPIVDLDSGQVVGYEALTRFADGRRPDLVFASAARVGLGGELELAAVQAALHVAARALPRDAYLSLNVSPGLIDSDALGRLLAGHDVAIVLEVTEHTAVHDYEPLRARLASLRPRVRLAIDDAGAGYASLRHVLELEPDLVKLDIGLVRGIEADPARQALLAGVVFFAQTRAIRLIAEGIETEAELAALLALGVSHGQGFLFGRPREAVGSEPWPTHVELRPAMAVGGRIPT
jgi:PAS domain S-box-containing protein